MDLLVIKVEDRYLRFVDAGYEFTGMNKATVFPISDKAKVVEKYEYLKLELKNVSIKKLTIIESDFEY